MQLQQKSEIIFLISKKKTDVDRKSWAIQREVGIIERKRMTSAISKVSA